MTVSKRDERKLLLHRHGVLSQPVQQFRRTETAVFIQIDQEIVGVYIVEFQAVVVYAEKSARYSNRHSLVAINEWVVLREALPQRRGLFQSIRVVATPWSSESGFQRSSIAKTGRSAKPVEQTGMDFENFLDTRVVSHRLRRSSSSECCSVNSSIAVKNGLRGGEDFRRRNSINRRTTAFSSGLRESTSSGKDLVGMRS